MIIHSGDITKRIAFVALNAAGQRVTGLNGFTVRRSRNGETQVAMTTPTITEDASATGDYWLLVDEDTTLPVGEHSQEMRFVISHASMQTVSRAIEIRRPIAEQTWASLLPGAYTAGSAGYILGQLTSFEIVATPEFLQAIADKVLDEPAADHNTAGSIGAEIQTGGVDWAEIVADHDDVPGSFGERLSRIPNAAPGVNGGLPTVNASNYIAGIQGTLNQLDDINLSPVIDVEVVGGGPVEHSPVAETRMRKLSRRSDGTTGLNRPWASKANETLWHGVECKSQLADGHSLTAIAAPTVSGGGGAITVQDYGVLETDAKVRIAVANGTAVGTTATINIVLTPTVGEQLTIAAAFEVLT
jgi:hypothetical protein